MPLRDHVEASRYEYPVGEALAYVEYRREDGIARLSYAYVPPALEGRGVGSAMVRAVLADVRRRGERVVATCSFIRAYLERHPEYHDLVAR